MMQNDTRRKIAGAPNSFGPGPGWKVWSKSNQKTYNEFGSMLAPEQQSEVRIILDDARAALESGSATDCTEALEKIATMGKILSEVILYDPGQFSSAGEGEGTKES